MPCHIHSGVASGDRSGNRTITEVAAETGSSVASSNETAIMSDPAVSVMTSGFAEATFAPASAVSPISTRTGVLTLRTAKVSTSVSGSGSDATTSGEVSGSAVVTTSTTAAVATTSTAGTEVSVASSFVSLIAVGEGSSVGMLDIAVAVGGTEVSVGTCATGPDSPGRDTGIIPTAERQRQK